MGRSRANLGGYPSALNELDIKPCTLLETTHGGSTKNISITFNVHKINLLQTCGDLGHKAPKVLGLVKFDSRGLCHLCGAVCDNLGK